MDFSIVERAGLKAIDIHKILGVSRATAGAWMSGRGNPSPNMRHYAALTHMLRVLEKALDEGKLPRKDMSAEVRNAVVEKIKTLVSKINT